MTGDEGWRLVTHESPRPMHNAVRRMDDWLSREGELGIDPFKWRPEAARRHPEWEAWLLGMRPLGGAIFTEDGLGGAAWHLERVWIAPHLRGGGVLSRVWPIWMARYGSVSTVPSPAFRRFVQARGWSPIDPERGGFVFWRSPIVEAVRPTGGRGDVVGAGG